MPLIQFLIESNENISISALQCTVLGETFINFLHKTIPLIEIALSPMFAAAPKPDPLRCWQRRLHVAREIKINPLSLIFDEQSLRFVFSEYREASDWTFKEILNQQSISIDSPHGEIVSITDDLCTYYRLQYDHRTLSELVTSLCDPEVNACSTSQETDDIDQLKRKPSNAKHHPPFQPRKKEKRLANQQNQILTPTLSHLRALKLSMNGKLNLKMTSPRWREDGPYLKTRRTCRKVFLYTFGNLWKMTKSPR